MQLVQVVGRLFVAPPTQPVVAQVECHAMQPGVEAGLPRSPVRGLLPHAHQGFLRHVFGLTALPQQALGERQQPRQLARDHLAHRRRFATANARQQLRVGIILAQWS